MADWQIIALFVLAGCAIGCLLGIYKAVEQLSRAIFSIRMELTKMNSKLEAVETVNKQQPGKPAGKTYEPNPSLEKAIRDLENLDVRLEKPRDKKE